MAVNTATTGVVTTVTLILVLGAVPPLAPALGDDATESAIGPAAEAQPEYNVTFSSTSIGELVLRNVVIQNVQVGEVRIDEMTIGGETTENVELENVTLAHLDIERAVVQDVSTGELSVRNRSVLDVPGGELIGNAGDRSLERHVIDNLTVTGVEIERLHLANLTVETEIEAIEGDLDAEPDEEVEKPDVSIGEAEAPNASVTNASFQQGAVESASVEDETVTPETEGDDGEDGNDDEGDGGDGDENAVNARTGR